MFVMFIIESADTDSTIERRNHYENFRTNQSRKNHI